MHICNIFEGQHMSEGGQPDLYTQTLYMTVYLVISLPTNNRICTMLIHLSSLVLWVE